MKTFILTQLVCGTLLAQTYNGSVTVTNDSGKVATGTFVLNFEASTNSPTPTSPPAHPATPSPPPVQTNQLATAYSTLTTNGAWGASFYTLADPGSVNGANAALEVAVPIVPIVAGRLEGVEVPLMRRTDSLGNSAPRKFVFTADNGGKPGKVLETWEVLPSEVMTRIRLESKNEITLIAGNRYWLIGQMNPTGKSRDTWADNALGISGSFLYKTKPTSAYTSINLKLPSCKVTVLKPIDIR